MLRVFLCAVLLVCAPLCAASGMCRNSSAFLPTHETIVNCAGLTQAQCEAAHNNPCTTEWKPETLICEFKPTAGAVGLQRQSCTDASGTVDHVVTCGDYPAFYFSDVEHASDCTKPNVRLPQMTNGQLMDVFARSPWGCCSDGASVCSDPSSHPQVGSNVAVFRDMDGNLHINSIDNQTVYINGVDVIDRLMGLESRLHEAERGQAYATVHPTALPTISTTLSPTTSPTGAPSMMMEITDQGMCEAQGPSCHWRADVNKCFKVDTNNCPSYCCGCQSSDQDDCCPGVGGRYFGQDCCGSLLCPSDRNFCALPMPKPHKTSFGSICQVMVTPTSNPTSSPTPAGPRQSNTNILLKPYTGTRTTVGWFGFGFKVEKAFNISGVGFAIGTGGRPSQASTVELHLQPDAVTQTVPGPVVLSVAIPSTSIEINGYTFEPLATPFTVYKDQVFRIVRGTTGGSNDMFNDCDHCEGQSLDILSSTDGSPLISTMGHWVRNNYNGYLDASTAHFPRYTGVVTFFVETPA